MKEQYLNTKLYDDLPVIIEYTIDGDREEFWIESWKIVNIAGKQHEYTPRWLCQFIEDQAINIEAIIMEHIRSEKEDYEPS